ncbi:MAG: sporulation protein YtfJ [Ruminococcaceae bacterium]|nr:sporulation protein YtfJ [Oscillospiraceae bacterium]
MSDHPINSLMDTTMRKIKEMIDVNTIIGDPITTPDGTTIIPVSKVSYGFASGGSDLPTKRDNKECFGGGSGAGVTINPVAFLSVSNGNVKLIPIEKYDGAVDRIVGMVPDMFDKVSEYFKKDKKDDIDVSDLDKDIDEFEI